MTVYILQDNPKSPLDFLPAEKFGKLNVVYDRNITPHHMQRLVGDLREKLRGSAPDDYVIPVGPPALIALAGFIWLSQHGQMRLLVWDRHRGDYYEVCIKS